MTAPVTPGTFARFLTDWLARRRREGTAPPLRIIADKDAATVRTLRPGEIRRFMPPPRVTPINTLTDPRIL